MDYMEIDKVNKEKLKRRSKVVKQCVNCGKYKDLTNGETMEYTRNRNLKNVAVCNIDCKKAFIKNEMDYLQNKVDWLKAELE